MSEKHTTEKELAACRAAFKGVPVGTWCWLIHHEILAERLLEPIEARIACILADKPEWQHPRRFREMRPVKAVDDPVFVAAVAAWDCAVTAWDCAVTAWGRAKADWGRAKADWDRADWDCAVTAWDRAVADWGRASAAWKRVKATFARAVGPLHRREQPESAWDGETIFPESRKEEV